MLALESPADAVPTHTDARRFDLGRRIGVLLGASCYRVRIRGVERVPATGPLVVVANHTAFMDGPLLYGQLPRRTSFLVKAEAVQGILGWVLREAGQYAIDRDRPDRTVLLAALAQLKAGGAIGVFPEGTRGAGVVDSVFNGAGWLATRAGATVLPIAVRGAARPDGASRRFRPRVDMLVGRPFPVTAGAGRSAVATTTDAIQRQLAALVADLDRDLTGRRG
ncbi:1-acyl-sn-glycerol-3-phosphate acyltransferase [Nakamurella sp. YIM 132084]|uniref:1-acyl-sn-glycerol-3-phosphate acyltransferase n=1 Tax=Nakamurella leprariae TaxID=2803911 RepID=A0A938YBU1_9ACTN|nr:1-acyl-sn-glycerol-3-phosphate acyltransferase [Nakamurella leprariae]